MAEGKQSSSTEYNINHLLYKVGTSLRKKQLYEPHKILAELPLPIYITANQDYLLEDALREVGKDPQSFLCPWNPDINQLCEPFFEPTVDRPMVFHMFGTWDQPASVALTEDQYFDFLTGVTANRDLIPATVRQALVNTSLLILGFRTEEWGFRVIFRILQMLPGASRHKFFAQIAAQSEPEDGRILEPLRAKRYLEQYFQKSSIDIFWGTAEDFLSQLITQVNQSGKIGQEDRPL